MVTNTTEIAFRPLSQNPLGSLTIEIFMPSPPEWRGEGPSERSYPFEPFLAFAACLCLVFAAGLGAGASCGKPLGSVRVVLGDQGRHIGVGNLLARSIVFPADNRVNAKLQAGGTVIGPSM